MTCYVIQYPVSISISACNKLHVNVRHGYLFDTVVRCFYISYILSCIEILLHRNVKLISEIKSIIYIITEIEYKNNNGFLGFESAMTTEPAKSLKGCFV